MIERLTKPDLGDPHRYLLQQHEESQIIMLQLPPPMV
jgi:hypothetical protein